MNELIKRLLAMMQQRQQQQQSPILSPQEEAKPWLVPQQSAPMAPQLEEAASSFRGSMAPAQTPDSRPQQTWQNLNTQSGTTPSPGPPVPPMGMPSPLGTAPSYPGSVPFPESVSDNPLALALSEMAKREEMKKRIGGWSSQ